MLSVLMFGLTAGLVGRWAQTRKRRNAWVWGAITLALCALVWMVVFLGIHGGVSPLTDLNMERNGGHSTSALILVDLIVCAVAAGIALIVLTSAPREPRA